jgi:hypothetical protein
MRFVAHVKNKTVPDHSMKAYWGSRGIAPLILNLDSRWIYVVNLKPRSLYPRGKPLVGYWSLSEPQNRFERFGEEKNFLPMPGIEQSSP